MRVMLNEYIVALAKKNGASMRKMPMRNGKPLGKCTKADLNKLIAMSDRIHELVRRAARGQVLSAKDRRYLTRYLEADEVYQAEALVWALNRNRGT